MLPMVRPYMIVQTLLVVIPSALWVSSIHVDYPNRLALIWIALCLGKVSQPKQSVLAWLFLLTKSRSFWCTDYCVLFSQSEKISPEDG